MGCNASSAAKSKRAKEVLSSAIIIQNWHRCHLARLRIRQHRAFAIFQSIDYADEQSQLQLSNFFTFMLENYAYVRERDQEFINRMLGYSLQDKGRLECVGLIDVPYSYTGPRLEFPLTFGDLPILIEAFKKGRKLHARYVLEVLYETKKTLSFRPNFTHVKTSPTKDITICGRSGFDNPIKPFPFLASDGGDRDLMEWYVLHDMPQLRIFEESLMVPFQLISPPHLCLAGDLHGRLDDLLLIFHENGLPSETNSYIFNGDFVDRGYESIEILMILFVSFLTYRTSVHLNRGNHEDFLMNMRYGFTKEVLHKYKLYGKKILQLLEEVFAWLPFGTVIDNDILVVHGGISDSTDLRLLSKIKRNKMKSMLKPPTLDESHNIDWKKNKIGMVKDSYASTSYSQQLAKHEWEQVMDILWSDPRSKKGCYPNTSRGGGCYFGPDVTSEFLDKYHLRMIIRSHECKSEGYEVCHDGKVITVFSVSNYYGEGSNRGAYIRLNFGLIPRFFDFRVPEATCLRPFYRRVNTIETRAIKMLKERIISRKSDLIHAFQLRDCNKSGKLSMSQWASSMENVLGLNLPWIALSSRLVTRDKNGKIDYMSCFDDMYIQTPAEEISPALIETLHRYRHDLQIIFNIIDSDHSGLISMEEFRSMWHLFSKNYNICIDDSQVDELARRMDLNKDGSIDFNEFLKAFFVVHELNHLKK